MTFRVRSNGTVRVPPHRDLVRLHQSYLTILIKNTEGVSLGFENDTDSLQAVHQLSDKHMQGRRVIGSLELDQVVQFIIANNVGSRTDFGGLTQIFGEHGNLRGY